MRAVTHGDVTAAARFLMTLPEAERRVAARRLLVLAHWADHYRKRSGRAHPVWGNGSLAAAIPAVALPAEPRLSDLGYVRCLSTVIEAVLDWRGRVA